MEPPRNPGGSRTVRLPRDRPPTHRHRAGPPSTHRHHHQPHPGQPQGPDRPLRPPHDHRTAPGGDHPRLLRRRLFSTVNLNVDLDIMLAVLAQALLAQALLAALRARLPGYHAVTPDTLQRRFLE